MLETESVNATTIGAVLRKAREDAGMRQGELAAILGISIWTMNRLEHGKRRFDVAWLSHLPPRMQVPVAALLSSEARQQYWHLQSLGRQTLPAA